jgi:hypothetical protein
MGVRGRGRFAIGVLVLPTMVVLTLPGVAAGGGPAGESGPEAPAGPPRLPEVGAWFGTNASAAREEAGSKIEGIEVHEELTGRKMGVARVYMLWDEPFPIELMQWLSDRGTIPVFSLQTSRARQPPIVTWQEVASGTEDDVIDAVADQIKALGTPMIFAFASEPESEGDPAAFIRAYRHVHARFAARGVTNVSFATILLSYTYRLGEGDPWYPGDDYVDILGADGYNWYGCPGRDDPWRTFDYVFGRFYEYGVAQGKPMMIPEYGSMEDPEVPGRKAAWLTEAAATLKTWPELKALTYYDNGGAPECDWWIDSSQSALNAFSAMGADPYFNPPPPLVTIVTGPSDPDNSSSATFVFTSNRPRAIFTCSVDGGPRVACLSPHTFTGLVDGAHTAMIEATDVEGPTGRLVYRWTVDATAPVATILWGPNEYTQQTDATFHLETSEADSGGFTCVLDFVPAPECRAWASFDGLADGLHTFVARAYDDAGNLSAPVRWFWTVDTTPPTATIVSGPPRQWDSRTATFEFVSNEPDSTFRCSMDGSMFIICGSPKTYQGLLDGRHTFTVLAVDIAKNESLAAEWTFNVDAIP